LKEGGQVIIAEQKPISEIAVLIEGYKNILLLGCGGCVTVCLTGCHGHGKSQAG